MLVDLLVAPPDRQGGVEVQRRIGVQHLVQAGGHQSAHPLDRAHQGQHRLGGRENQAALGDVAGQVAAALKVHRQLEGGDGASQVLVAWSVHGNQLQRATLDLGLHAVEPQITDDQGLGEGHGPADHGVDRVHHLGLGQAAHTDDLCGQGALLGLIGLVETDLSQLESFLFQSLSDPYDSFATAIRQSEDRC